jgi:hypothetical protein
MVQVHLGPLRQVPLSTLLGATSFKAYAPVCKTSAWFFWLDIFD